VHPTRSETTVPVSASLIVAPAAPNHGDTVTAIYAVTGNDPVPGAPLRVSGNVAVGPSEYSVTATITPAGAPPLPVSYVLPSCPGLTFTATGDPAVFIAVVP
jgi:hypothetical protein